MINYKKIDLGLQLIAFVTTALLLLGKAPLSGIYGLIALGGLQVISMIIHFFLKPALWISSRRKIYYILCAASLIIMSITLFTDMIKDDITLMVWMIPVTGALAIYYMVICLLEIKQLQKQKIKIPEMQ